VFGTDAVVNTTFCNGGNWGRPKPVACESVEVKLAIDFLLFSFKAPGMLKNNLSKLQSSIFDNNLLNLSLYVLQHYTKKKNNNKLAGPKAQLLGTVSDNTAF